MKPNNICVGNHDELDNLQQLKLIDFGLASPFVVKNEITGEFDHIKLASNEFQGNLAFSSKNAFDQITLSRRDDFISLVYMLTYLASGKLLFIIPQIPLEKQIGNIKRKKNKYSAEKVCRMQKCKYLLELLEMVYNLKFEETPDYNAMRWILKKNLLDINMAPNHR
jgi:serine/threonine protein kinase